MTLRTRLTVIVTAVVAVAVAVAAYAVLFSTRRELRSQVDSFLISRADRLVRAPQALGPAGRPGAGANAPRLGAERGLLADLDAVVQVLNRQGAVAQSITGQPGLPVTETDRRLAQSTTGRTARDVTVDGVHYRLITAALRNGGAVQIARSLEETDEVLAALRTRLLVIGGLGTLLAGAVAWSVARRTTRPIEQLTEASERVAATQDLAIPIPVTGNDEVGRLATSFNTMLTALEASRQQQRRLVMDASHELRTPLTAVRTNIEFLARATDLDAGERTKLVTETGVELQELTDLVAELVDLATDARNEEPVQAVDLAEVVSDVAARYRRRTGREVSVTTLGAAAVQGRPSMIDRAVSNLVDNALKFSAAPAPVDVAVDGAAVMVSDRGPGIAAADRSQVFDRFYRAPAARTLPGSGLGLAIVKQIAELHGGSVTLSEREGGGTLARLETRPAGRVAV